MSRLFEQAGSMSFQRAATSGGLTGEFRLNLRPDVNGDCHGPPPKLYGTAALGFSQTSRLCILGLSPSLYVGGYTRPGSCARTVGQGWKEGSQRTAEPSGSSNSWWRQLPAPRPSRSPAAAVKTAWAYDGISSPSRGLLPPLRLMILSKALKSARACRSVKYVAVQMADARAASTA